MELVSAEFVYFKNRSETWKVCLFLQGLDVGRPGLSSEECDRSLCGLGQALLIQSKEVTLALSLESYWELVIVCVCDVCVCVGGEWRWIDGGLGHHGNSFSCFSVRGLFEYLHIIPGRI